MQVSQLRFPEVILRVMAEVMGKLSGFPLTTDRVDALIRRSIFNQIYTGRAWLSTCCFNGRRGKKAGFRLYET